MSNISVDYDVLNQRGSPAWFTDTFANIPTAGYVGRMFISTDTFAFYRDTGTGWDLIGGPGSGTITGSGVTGQVSFFNGTQVLAGNNNLFWDNTNSRLGINTITPGAPLDIHSTGTNAQFNGTGTNNAYLIFQNAGTSKWRIGNTYNAGANSFDIYNNGLASTPLSINSSTNAFSLTGSLSVNLGGVSLSTTIQALSGNTSNFAAVSVGRIGVEGYLGICSTANDFAVGTIAGDVAVTSGSSKLQLAANSNIGITINSTGKVGISNTSPIYNLDITGNFQVSSSAIFGSTIGNGTYTYTLPSATGTLALTSNLSSYLALTGGTLTGGLNLTYTSPQIILNASTGGTNTIAFNVNSAAVGNITIGASFYQFTNFTSGGWLFKNSVGSNVLAIADNGVSVFTNTITGTTFNSSGDSYFGTTSGKVGIGNSNPTVLLSIGTSQTSPVAAADVTLGLNKYILWGTSGSGAGTVRSWGIANNELAAGDFVIKSSSTNNNTLDTVRLQITNAGIVTISALGTGTVTATSGTLSIVSDMNLKIADGFIYNALEKVLKLTPRYFYWKEESNLPTNLRQLGFYAQEVNEAIGEEAANTPKDNVSWGITDRSVIAMLTKAIQELNEKLVRNNIN